MHGREWVGGWVGELKRCAAVWAARGRPRPNSPAQQGSSQAPSCWSPAGHGDLCVCSVPTAQGLPAMPRAQRSPAVPRTRTVIVSTLRHRPPQQKTRASHVRSQATTTTSDPRRTFTNMSMKPSCAFGMFMVALLQNPDTGNPALASLSPCAGAAHARGHSAMSGLKLASSHVRPRPHCARCLASAQSGPCSPLRLLPCQHAGRPMQSPAPAALPARGAAHAVPCACCLASAQSGPCSPPCLLPCERAGRPTQTPVCKPCACWRWPCQHARRPTRPPCLLPCQRAPAHRTPG